MNEGYLFDCLRELENLQLVSLLGVGKILTKS